MAVITLTTDFGTKDWFVGVMKGVLLARAPEARVIDLTHELQPGDIRAGAFALMASYRFFPRGSVHVVVVDPGVGSARRALAVRTRDYFFVGPDNGVLSWALRGEKVQSTRVIENPAYMLSPVSRTFHGRDIFAPAAGCLSAGRPFEKIGPVLKRIERLPWAEPQVTSKQASGEILYIDRFGNAISNLDSASLQPLGGELAVSAGSLKRCPVAEFYQAVPTGKPVAVLGSSGFLEIAVNGGSAAERLGLKPGLQVVVSRVI